MTTYTLLLAMFLAVFTNASLTLALLDFPASAAEQPQVRQFKNIDEMIGWVKAKGNCEKMMNVTLKKPSGQKCKIRIDLPNEERIEGNGKGVWQVWAWIEATEFYPPNPESYFFVKIYKSRNFTLLATAPSSTIRSLKKSHYSFRENGVLSEVSTGVSLELPNGEVLLEHEIHLPLEFRLKHGEGPSDNIIISQLGIRWQY